MKTRCFKKQTLNLFAIFSDSFVKFNLIPGKIM